jgi:hypothetical protein
VTTTQQTDELMALQAEFPGWRIWRARRKDKRGGTEPGSWMASRLERTAGVDRTLMEPSADELREALVDQRERAKRGQRSYEVLPYGGGV